MSRASCAFSQAGVGVDLAVQAAEGVDDTGQSQGEQRRKRQREDAYRATKARLKAEAAEARAQGVAPEDATSGSAPAAGGVFGFLNRGALNRAEAGAAAPSSVGRGSSGGGVCGRCGGAHGAQCCPYYRKERADGDSGVAAGLAR